MRDDSTLERSGNDCSREANLFYPNFNQTTNRYILQDPTKVFLTSRTSFFILILIEEIVWEMRIIPITNKIKKLYCFFNNKTCHKHLCHIHSQSVCATRKILFWKKNYSSLSLSLDLQSRAPQKSRAFRIIFVSKKAH